MCNHRVQLLMAPNGWRTSVYCQRKGQKCELSEMLKFLTRVGMMTIWKQT